MTLSSPPALLAALTSPLPRLLEVARAREEVADLLVVDHRRQPVGAEEEEVARLGLDRERVDVDLAVRAERARDHRALRVSVGLLGGEAPAPHEVGDERVVVGELLELPAAQPIGPGVADVADDERVGRDERGGDRRSHAGDLRVVVPRARRSAGSPPG